jgi:hypothetical protein
MEGPLELQDVRSYLFSHVSISCDGDDCCLEGALHVVAPAPCVTRIQLSVCLCLMPAHHGVAGEDTMPSLASTRIQLTCDNLVVIGKLGAAWGTVAGMASMSDGGGPGGHRCT